MRSSVIFAVGFRPFFLLAPIAAAGVIGGWLALLAGARWPGAPAGGLDWHAHEMLFGFVGAAVAGFLLTAVPSFTARPPLRGAPLAALVLLWIAARLAAPAGGVLPAGVVAAPDVGFWAFLVAVVTRDIVAARNRANLVLVAVLVALGAAAAASHVLRARTGSGIAAVEAGVHVVLLLVTVIAGRIVPAFTRNWMRTRGLGPEPASVGWNEAAVVVATVAAGMLDLWASASVAGGAALAAALMHGLRLSRWRGLAARRDPLLLVLHAGYAWLVAGYLVLALSGLAGTPTRSAALHALTMGAMGTMILAVMSRVALGHTGRALRAPRPVVAAYALVGIAAISRVAAAVAGNAYLALVTAAGLAWAAAFAIFLATYAPILTRPRVDQ